MSSKDPMLQARLDTFINFKVRYPRLEEMDQDLMQRISGHRRYTILAVFGAAGVGKSTVMQRVAEKLRAEEPDPRSCRWSSSKLPRKMLAPLPVWITTAKSSNYCKGITHTPNTDQR